jgi:hypothetical protein
MTTCNAKSAQERPRTRKESIIRTLPRKWWLRGGKDPPKAKRLNGVQSQLLAYSNTDVSKAKPQSHFRFRPIERNAEPSGACDICSHQSKIRELRFLAMRRIPVYDRVCAHSAFNTSRSGSLEPAPGFGLGQDQVTRRRRRQTSQGAERQCYCFKLSSRVRSRRSNKPPISRVFRDTLLPTRISKHSARLNCSPANFSFPSCRLKMLPLDQRNERKPYRGKFRMVDCKLQMELHTPSCRTQHWA